MANENYFIFTAADIKQFEMRFCFLVPVLLGISAVPAWTADATLAAPAEPLSVALRQLYNSQFDQSRQTLASYAVGNPQDPLTYALKAASYFFAELDRTGAMQKDLFDEHTAAEKKTAAMSDQDRNALEDAIQQTRQRAEPVLHTNPNDTNALLALLIASGIERDYLALVEHKYRESYDYIKESEGYASRLLKVNPGAYDAYFTQGFTEYLIGSMPFFLRWFMKMDNLNCTKQQGLHDLQLAADHGQYMKPFAQLMLAMFYMKENQGKKTEALLGRLSQDFPENQTFRRELNKVRSQQQD
jgi:hypothetical protein